MSYYRAPQRKSFVIAVLLTIFLGPLGLAYASVAGAAALGLMELGFIGVSFMTFGLLHFLTLIPYVGSIVWAIIAVERRNRMAFDPLSLSMRIP